MARLMTALVLAAVGLSLGIAVVAKDQTARVFVNGTERRMNPPAMVRDGTTYVPLRAGAEALGAEVKWDGERKIATITQGNRRVRISESQGIIVEGRLLIPLRTMAEALSCEVKWDGQAKAVRITQQGSAPSAVG